MPKYRVAVVNRKTGDPETDVVVEANTEDEAVKRATDGGRLLVESIVEVTDLDELADVGGARVIPTPVNPAPPRRRRSTPIPSTPRYFWLNLWGAIYVLSGALIVLVTVIAAVVSFFQDYKHGTGPWPLGGYAFLLVYGPWFLFGASLLACGQLIYGFRDMARNSWKVHRVVQLLESRA